MRVLMVLLLLLNGACTAQKATAKRGEPHFVVDTDERGQCLHRMGEERLDVDQVMQRAASWPNKSAEIRVGGVGAKVPYRCVGGLIYALQSAGFYQISFE